MNSTYAQAINEIIKQALETDPTVIILGNAVSTGGRHGVYQDLYETYGELRIIDTPVGDDASAGFALGLAMTGAHPILEINGDYLLRCMDTITNQIALTDSLTDSQFGSALIIRADIGYTHGQSPQRSQSFESMFCQIPGLTVVYPSDISDARSLMKAAIQAKRPVLFLEHKEIYKKQEKISQSFIKNEKLGKANILHQGNDITLITYGPYVDLCKEAIKIVEQEEVSCELIDLRTLHPIDHTTICQSVKKTGKAIIVHEAHKTGGLGAEIMATIVESDAFDYLEVPIARICSKDMPVPHSKKGFANITPSIETISNKIMELTY